MGRMMHGDGTPIGSMAESGGPPGAAPASAEAIASFRAWVRAIWLAGSTPEAAIGWNIANEVEELRGREGGSPDEALQVQISEIVLAVQNNYYTEFGLKDLQDDLAELVRLAVRPPSGPALSEARQIVNEQANDEALWFMAPTISEAYLQQALRRLHAAVERATGGETGPLAPSGPAPDETEELRQLSLAKMEVLDAADRWCDGDVSEEAIRKAVQRYRDAVATYGASRPARKRPVRRLAPSGRAAARGPEPTMVMRVIAPGVSVPFDDAHKHSGPGTSGEAPTR